MKYIINLKIIYVINKIKLIYFFFKMLKKTIIINNKIRENNKINYIFK